METLLAEEKILTPSFVSTLLKSSKINLESISIKTKWPSRESENLLKKLKSNFLVPNPLKSIYLI
jgi:hypothetical protein